MTATAPSPVFVLVFAGTVGLILLTIFAWGWAVRRKPLGTGSLTYVALGGSDVEGVGANDPDSENWASVVHAHMPPGTKLVRLGRSGITLAVALTTEIPAAIRARPDLVTMWYGVNDATGGVPLESFTSNLERALSELTGKTSAAVLVLNLPDFAALLERTASPEQVATVRGGILQWNAAIERTAARFGDRVRVLDLIERGQSMSDHPEYISPDGFHPSAEGYRALGLLVVQTLRDYGMPRIRNASAVEREAK